MSQDKFASGINDLEAIAAVFGPLARILEPLIDRYRPAIDALTEAVGEAAATLSDESPDPAFVQARVEAAVPLLVSTIKEQGLPDASGLLAIWGATADVDSEAPADADAPQPTASQIDGELDGVEQSDLQACAKALGVVAGLIAPVYQQHRPMYDALSRAVATVISESEDELPDAAEVARMIRSVANEVQPLLVKLKNDEVELQTVLGAIGLLLMANSGGEKSALTAFKTGRYNRAEFERYGQEVGGGLPGVAVAQAIIAQLTEHPMLPIETAEEALGYLAAQVEGEYHLLNPDAIDTTADDEESDS